MQYFETLYTRVCTLTLCLFSQSNYKTDRYSKKRVQ